MMCKGKRRSATVYLVAVVILLCHLVQMIHCRRLKETETRGGRNEADAAKTIGFQEGEIVFGSVSEKVSGLSSQILDGTKNFSSNASVADEAAYQSDSTGWSKEHAQDAASREALWKRMASSLQCGEDQMKFRAVGPGVSHFAVEQGNAPPLPLSQVPSTCGYSMRMNSFALIMLVPYDGCNIIHEGGHHMLPMRWQGLPVSLLCPKTAIPSGLHHHTKKPGVSDPEKPPAYFFPPYENYPRYPFVGLPEQTTSKKPEMPEFPQYPSVFAPYPHFPSTPLATTPPRMFHHPLHPPHFPPFPWPYPGPLPATTLPQFPPYVPFDPPFVPPFIPHYPQHPRSEQQTANERALPWTLSQLDHHRFHPHGPVIDPQHPPYEQQLATETDFPGTRSQLDHHRFHPHVPFIHLQQTATETDLPVTRSPWDRRFHQHAKF